jgi:hypothetical protein
MPPIPRFYLHCSAYFYHSEQDAEAGERSGGSGFLINVPVEGHEGWSTLYAVTNRHVVNEGCLVLRLNKTEGGTRVIRTDRDAWFDHPSRYDVSVLPLDVENEQLQYSSIGTDEFITRDMIVDYRIGPGDECFLVGRVITPWGQQKNNPAVRFGSVSMMADPNEPARGYGGVEQESFFVDCRSLSGFSGSPVFVTTTQTYHKDDTHVPAKIRHPQGEPPAEEEGERKGLKIEFVATSGTFGPWLLGIDWGHLPLWKPVYERDEVTETNYRVEQNTGIACVLPAWHIVDLLNEGELVKERKNDKERLDRRKRESAILDVEKVAPLTRIGS